MSVSALKGKKRQRRKRIHKSKAEFRARFTKPVCFNENINYQEQHKGVNNACRSDEDLLPIKIMV